MAGIQNFTEIIAWQKAHELVLEIYQATHNFPKIEDYCLTSQIRRAVISIPSNIAEGFKRKSARDSVHFYNIADGSLEEVKYQLILAKDLKYISLEEFSKLYNLCEEVGRLLNGWVKIQK
ncbi:MAG: four helix bundle protein [bacterium]|nr:four helix bundle protein [bacterium]